MFLETEVGAGVGGFQLALGAKKAAGGCMRVQGCLTYQKTPPP